MDIKLNSGWEKLGMVYSPNGSNGFDHSHCHKPTPIILDDNTIRVFFGTRCWEGKTRTTFIDIDAENLTNIKYIHDKPILDIGKIGAFDDSGANVCSVVKVDNSLYMYHIGWNPSTTVHTRNSIGISISKDNGMTFSRLFDGPILDRNKIEPYYTGAVDVIKQGDSWKMWYTSGSTWKIINEKPEIFYHIKYAESSNGIDWVRKDISAISPENEFEAVARPSVLFCNGKYHMWFSKRSIIGFRTDSSNSYRAGYAVSGDGVNWDRQELYGMDLSQSGWDSEAIAYPYIIKQKNRLICFYNGNGFGKTGFGCSILNLK